MSFYQVWILTLVVHLTQVRSVPAASPLDVVLVPGPVAVTFTNPSALLRFNPWNFRKYSKVEIRFNTRERQGILLFVGAYSYTQDCIGIDIFDSNVYIYGILNEKEFRIKMNPNGTSVSDGSFHDIAIQLLPSGYFMMSFDGVPNPKKVQSPVVVEFETFTYIGGIDSTHRLPWIAYSQDGFAGSLGHIRVNDDQYIDTNRFANSTETRGIIPGIPRTLPTMCSPNVCYPGKCFERNYNLQDSTKNFFCDCSGTFKTYVSKAIDILRGETCSRDSTLFQCDKKSFLFYDFDSERITHTDDISLDFKTTRAEEPFFFAKKKYGDLSTFISSRLSQGRVLVAMKLQEGKDRRFNKVFVHTMNGLNDGRWHTLKIARYVQEVTISVDHDSNFIKGKLFRSSFRKKFYNKISEVYVGSLTPQPGVDKCSGTIKNLYWNDYDFLNTRNYQGRYKSQLMSYKPKLPTLPAYPRQPPKACTVKPKHTKTVIPMVPVGSNDSFVMIELKTKYDGILYCAEVQDSPNDWFAVLIMGNLVVIPYNLGQRTGVLQLDLIQGGINIRDDAWHRVVVELSQSKSSLTAFVDKAKEITKEVFFLKPLQQIKLLTFSVAGYSEMAQYFKILSVISHYSPSLLSSITDPTDMMFVGCLGELSTDRDGFTTNLLLGFSATHSPLDSVVCDTCREVTKCPRNFCENRGKCFNVNSNSISCNCSGTNFHGPSCSIRNPTCSPTDCQNGGVCTILADVKACNCTRTGHTGTLCEISRCTNYKCQNKAVCRIEDGQPICDCSGTLFFGSYCERPLCPKEFCINNGKCNLDQKTGLPYCDCQGTGHTGVRCDNQICTPNLCNGHGNCAVNSDKPSCTCEEEYTGRYCETGLCPEGLCLNGGICVVMKKKPVCACSADYDGDRCEQPKKCPKESCSNGGSCVLLGGIPKCDCSQTNYSGAKCHVPVACPENYCQNKGGCVVIQRKFSCNCSGTGYTGRLCENTMDCPEGFCLNGGVCSNKKGKYICDCSQTGHSGPKCDQQSKGMVCPYDELGFKVKRFIPPQITRNMTTSIGFQTWMPSGTIFCYQTVDEKYWSTKLTRGKLTIDINGKIFYMKTRVNDGKYHIINVMRDSNAFHISLDLPPVETMTVPIQITEILSLPDNLITYSKLIICNSCPDPDAENQFQGSVGAAKSGKDLTFDLENENLMATIGSVQNTLVPLNPLPTKKGTTSCTQGYCKHGGKCSMKGNRQTCDCGTNEYNGEQCDQKVYIMRPVPPKPGYIVHNIVPAAARNFDVWTFITRFISPSSPLATLILSDGGYLELKYTDDKIVVLINGVPYGYLNSDNLNQNVFYIFKIQNMLGRLTAYINKRKTGALTLPDSFLMPNGSMKVIKIIVGANKNLSETIKGVIGGYQFNSNKLIHPNGTLLPTSIVVRDILIEPWGVILKKALKTPKKQNESHGGMLFMRGISFYGNGYGVGAIVATGSGSFMLAPKARSLKSGIFLSPLALGFIVIILLMLSAIIWAICFMGRSGSFKSNIHDGRGISNDQITPLIKIQNKEFLVNENTASLKVGPAQSDVAKTSLPSFRMSIDKAKFEFISSVNKNHALESRTMFTPKRNLERISTKISHPEYMTVSHPGTGQMDLMKKLQLSDQRQQKYQMTNQVLKESGNKDVSKMNAFSEKDLKMESCILSEDGRFAITGSVCGPPQVWDLSNGDLIREMKGQHVTYTSLHLAMHGELLIGLGSEIPNKSAFQKLKVWKFQIGEEVSLTEQFYSSICCTSSDSLNCIIADETNDSAITILSLVNWETRKIRYNRRQSLFNDGIQFLKITNNSRFVIAGFRIDQNISCYHIFELMSNSEKKPTNFCIRSRLHSCDVINDTEMVVGTTDGELIVWNLESATATRQLLISQNTIEDFQTPHQNVVTCIEISRDKSLMVTGGSDTLVRIWDMQDESLSQSMTTHEDYVQCVALASDNEILVTGSLGGSIRAWNLKTGLEICNFVSEIKISKVLISNDKTVLVALGEKYGVNKLVMLKIVRSTIKVAKNHVLENDSDLTNYLTNDSL